MQTIHTAQTQYQSQFGRFATSLTELGPPQSGQPGPQSADLIDNNLATGEKSGYKFTVTGNQSGYVISAVPVAYNSTGSRTFYSDQTMQIRQNYGPEPATAQSPELRN
jgi:type IV pilus assembly protein PilA